MERESGKSARTFPFAVFVFHFGFFFSVSEKNEGHRKRRSELYDFESLLVRVLTKEFMFLEVTGDVIYANELFKQNFLTILLPIKGWYHFSAVFCRLIVILTKF